MIAILLIIIIAVLLSGQGKLGEVMGTILGILTMLFVFGLIGMIFC